MNVRYTPHPGQARIFAKQPTATKWKNAAEPGAKVMKIKGVGFVVYHSEKGWIKS